MSALKLQHCVLFVLTCTSGYLRASAWTPPLVPIVNGKSAKGASSLLGLSSSLSNSVTGETELSYTPLFSFARNDTVAQFDRIDDVIMGGVSSSTLLDVPDEPFAKWFGMCRTTGGGFCGVRTLPFAQPLNLTDDAQGFYVTCRLASDQEPQRRAWKMSTRNQPDRGEQLYQARFEFAQTNPEAWSTVKVPFDDFCLVRGPRAVPNGAPLNVSGGIYQIGMTMSKFGIGQNVTELENFREGPFELQIKEIGVYSKSPKNSAAGGNAAVNLPKIFTKDEARKQSSVVLKILRPVASLFFTEQSQRRKVAMKLLTANRNMTRTQAILFGLKSRAASSGWVASIVQTMTILCVDGLRAIAGVALRVLLFYPIRLVLKLIAFVKSIGKSGKSTPSA